ncbi:uncharacterized protein Dana_GF20479 [Drosophila ananassae]|uniref:Mitochondrial import receptor subunit TOM20 homolog n=1 Tax=Drosophila ananassae TaxID=7217 RepID=B3MQQ1_DROAN|nr:mitochondrial import receptor subunit TOM20 homolog B [Drosophila ananassae]EDV44677.1 uncharacterized protein Dana_GF20479 [Drosophila ananassae]
MIPPLSVNLALGMGIALFLSYCVYFDRKRISAPDYKKRVHERRRRNRMKNATIVPCVNNQASLEEYFLSQMKAGEDMIKQSRVEEGLTHFTNAIVLCAHPAEVIKFLKSSLPRHVHKMLVRKLKSIRALPSTEPEDNSDDDKPLKG